MKKILFVLLIVTLFSSVFIACGGGAQDKLVFMMWGDAEERIAVNGFLDKFAKKYPKIGKPKIIHTDSLSYWDKFQVMVAGGEIPDVYYMGVEELPSYLKQGILEDLTPYIKRDKKEINFDDFYKKPMNAFNIDGKQYGIAKDFATLVLYYNKDMFAANGVDYPDSDWTWNDLLSAARRLTVRKGNSIKTYGFIVETWTSWLPAWVRANGGHFMSADSKKWLLGAPGTIDKSAQALQFLADMMTRYKVAPDISTKKQLGSEGTFSSQKVAMCAYGRWAVLKFKKIKKFKWGIAELPKAPTTGKRASMLFTACYSISKKSKKKQNAWKLIKFLTSVEGQIDVAKSGQAIPSRKSVANSDAFLKSVEVNQYQTKLGNTIDHSVNLKALEYSDVVPSHVNWLDVRAKVDQWLQPVFLGTEKAKSKLKETQQKFQDILDK